MKYRFPLTVARTDQSWSSPNGARSDALRKSFCPKKTAKWVRWGNKETARNSAIPISAEPGGRNWRWQRKKCLERAPHDAIMPHLHDATNERRQQPQTFRCHPPQIQPTPTQTHTRTHAHKKKQQTSGETR